MLGAFRKSNSVKYTQESSQDPPKNHILMTSPDWSSECRASLRIRVMASRVPKLLCLLVLLAVCAAAQVSEFEDRRIVDIQFSPAQTLDPADLTRVFPLKKGEPLRAESVGRAIDGLFATGRFDDIVVEAEHSGSGVSLRFVTKNAWFVGGVSVSGKASLPPNRGQLASAAQLSLGAPFQEEDLTKAA